MEKTTSGGEQSNFAAAAAAAACLINVDGLYSICREQDACAGLYRCGVVVISGYTANELIIERRIDNYIVNI